ncbi:MAG: hypothetical protein A2V98_06135 [Planctomycetes bacterium RBG_16_64_12]|nr:MAG: hypothetical protein A2V98_06135 [Planctomycetes bacterium RBG_16_64_12]
MQSVWQNVAVLSIVMAAVVYLGRRLWRRRSSKNSPACHTCTECLQWWQEAPLAPEDPSRCGKEARAVTPDEPEPRERPPEPADQS